MDEPARHNEVQRRLATARSSKLRKFLHLTRSDQLLLLNAALLLGAIKLGLWLLPFQTLRYYLHRLAQTSVRPRQIKQSSVDKVVWAVLVAGYYLPGIKCLARALAIQLFLLRRGYPAVLRIGVLKEEGRKLAAHAWVEVQGQVVGGLANPLRYSLLPPL